MVRGGASRGELWLTFAVLFRTVIIPNMIELCKVLYAESIRKFRSDGQFRGVDRGSWGEGRVKLLFHKALWRIWTGMAGRSGGGRWSFLEKDEPWESERLQPASPVYVSHKLKYIPCFT